MKNSAIVVDEYTTPNPIVVTRDTSIPTIVELMNAHDMRHVPVVDGGRAVGIISQRDISVLANVPDIGDVKAEDFMVSSPYVVRSGTLLKDVVFHMAERKIGSALVVDERGEIEGIFTATDALNALVEVLRGDVDESATDAYLDDTQEGEAPIPH